MLAYVIPTATEAPVITGPPQGQWTYADWENLPDDGHRYEVIDGVLYMTTAPSNFHQWILRRLDRFLGIPAEDQGLGYAFMAPIGVLMPNCDPVQPDYIIVLRQNAAIIHDRRIRGVPDLIAEVLSPGNKTFDERIKLLAYAAAGVPEYVIIDPVTRSLNHYRLDSRGRYGYPDAAKVGDMIIFDCLPTISLPIAELFAGAPDTTL